MSRRIIPRSEWGNRYGLGWRIRPLPATTAWLHHSVTNAPGPGATLAQDIAHMRLLDQIGYQRFRYADGGWSRPAGAGISYSAVVMPSGRIFEGHGINRSSSHTSGYNTNGIGVCVAGNYDQQEPTAAALESAAWVLTEFRRRGNLRQARYNGGHRDSGFATSCPGSRLHRRIGSINARAAALDRGASPTPPAPPVSVEAGTVLEVTATAGLNGRAGAGVSHGIIASAAHGDLLTATGQVTGQWVRAHHETVAAWWHHDHLRTAPGVPAAVQRLLRDLDYSGDHAGIATYATDFDYTGSRTAWATLTTHLEDTMSKLDELDRKLGIVLANTNRDTRRLHEHRVRTGDASAGEIAAEVARRIPTAPTAAQNAAETVRQLLAHVIQGFSVAWWFRKGLVTDPKHRAFPADPGSPADKELRRELSETGHATVYTADGMLVLTLDEDGDRFKIEED